MVDPHTQIAIGLEQLVILTRVTFRNRDGQNYRTCRIECVRGCVFRTSEPSTAGISEPAFHRSVVTRVAPPMRMALAPGSSSLHLRRRARGFRRGGPEQGRRRGRSSFSLSRWLEAFLQSCSQDS
jgi:hypothetical protein